MSFPVNAFIAFSSGRSVCCWSQSQLSPGEGSVHPGQVASSSQGTLEQVGVQYLAQGHFDMQLSGAGICTSDFPITSRPALPAELQPPPSSSINSYKN